MRRKKVTEEITGTDFAAFNKAKKALCEEKGIAESVIDEALEPALVSAYKKQYKNPNVHVKFDQNTGTFEVYSFKIVVADDYEALEAEDLDKLDAMEEAGEDTEGFEPFFYDEKKHITVTEARKIVPGIEIGETIEEKVTPRDFGRVAAATAKQVIVQKIREAEKLAIVDEYQDKEDELVTGTVEMEDARNYYIHLGKTQGILPKAEIIPGEEIKMGSTIKAYVTKVEAGNKGAFILLSRTHYGFVKRLFELEIPEINEGIILVYSVAREAGVRTKIAVYSENSNVEAVGSCIGEKGSRINPIIEQLNGEKIDIVLYEKEPARFIENALSPAKNLHVYVTGEKEKEAIVVVDNENLSLAIGKKGLNVRLAARLTHFKLDIKTIEAAKEIGINIA
ncbi:MAG: transcription termination factor NusA [Bacilli bacterium]|nr:transcription termination factor NusA [Bacilli bacterium]